MYNRGSAFDRRAQAAAGAALPSELDVLTGVLNDPAATARREVEHASLPYLRFKLFRGDDKSAAEAAKELQEKRARLAHLQPETRVDHVLKQHKLFASYERYIVLKAQEEALRIARQAEEVEEERRGAAGGQEQPPRAWGQQQQQQQQQQPVAPSAWLGKVRCGCSLRTSGALVWLPFLTHALSKATGFIFLHPPAAPIAGVREPGGGAAWPPRLQRPPGLRERRQGLQEQPICGGVAGEEHLEAARLIESSSSSICCS